MMNRLTGNMLIFGMALSLCGGASHAGTMDDLASLPLLGYTAARVPAEMGVPPPDRARTLADARYETEIAATEGIPGHVNVAGRRPVLETRALRTPLLEIRLPAPSSMGSPSELAPYWPKPPLRLRALEDLRGPSR